MSEGERAEPLTEEKIRCPDCRQTGCDVLPHEVLAEDVAEAVRFAKELIDAEEPHHFSNRQKERVHEILDEAFPQNEDDRGR